jgi:hypothetical protein
MILVGLAEQGLNFKGTTFFRSSDTVNVDMIGRIVQR